MFSLAFTLADPRRIPVAVFSGWTETRAVKNKAQVWVFAALKDVESSLLFPLLGIDSDNGGEFINAELFRYCEAGEITFTRARPYRKNDSCYVEEKNYSVVRRNAGYFRHDTEEEVALLNELYRSLRLYTNFFLPVMKLTEKTRVASKVTKKYDEAKTPCQRLLLSPDMNAEAKERLQEQYETLNPAELKRSILKLQKRLLELCRLKEEIRRKEVLSAEDFEYISDEATNPQLEYILS